MAFPNENLATKNALLCLIILICWKTSTTPTFFFSCFRLQFFQVWMGQMRFKAGVGKLILYWPCIHNIWTNNLTGGGVKWVLTSLVLQVYFNNFLKIRKLLKYTHNISGVNTPFIQHPLEYIVQMLYIQGRYRPHQLCTLGSGTYNIQKNLKDSFQVLQNYLTITIWTKEETLRKFFNTGGASFNFDQAVSGFIQRNKSPQCGFLLTHQVLEHEGL